MKTYRVVAALIEHDGKFLAMQRGKTRFPYTSHLYELPGGKVEPGETELEALRRELREEMDYEVEVGSHLADIDHAYPDFAVHLSIYHCHASTPCFEMREHRAYQWLPPQQLADLPWVEADRHFISHIQELL